MTDNGWLTTAEAAALLGLSRWRVDVLCQNGILAPAYLRPRNGKRAWFVERAVVEAEVERRKAEPDRKRWRYPQAQPEPEIELEETPNPLRPGAADKYQCMFGWFQHRPQPPEGKRKAYCRKCKAPDCVHHRGFTPRQVVKGLASRRRLAEGADG